MKKKAAIFDLDGTLVDAYEAIKRNFNFALKRLGYPEVSLDEVKKAVGGGDSSLAGSFVEEEDIPKMMEIYRENHNRFLGGGTKLMGGSADLLAFLKSEKIKVGVATNRRFFSADALLEELKIKRYFDIICTADDVANPKPHPDMLLRIADFLGDCRKEEIFYVGDMDIDYFAGKNAGIETFIVSTGSSPKEYLETLEGINLFDNLILLKEFLEQQYR